MPMMQNNNQQRTKYFNADTGNRILLMLLIFAILVNLGPFGAIKYSHKEPGYRIIFKLANVGNPSVEGILHRRGLYLALRQIAPGASVLLPKDSSLDIAQIYGLGRAKHVEYAEYDPNRLGADIDFSDHIVAGFNGDIRRGPGPFAVAVKNKKPETIVILKRNHTWLVVDSELLHLK